MLGHFRKKSFIFLSSNFFFPWEYLLHLSMETEEGVWLRYRSQLKGTYSICHLATWFILTALSSLRCGLFHRSLTFILFVFRPILGVVHRTISLSHAGLNLPILFFGGRALKATIVGRLFFTQKAYWRRRKKSLPYSPNESHFKVLMGRWSLHRY